MRTILAILALTCSAFAGSQTVHGSFGVYDTSVSIPAFDSTMGDLYEVQVNGTAVYQRTLYAENFYTDQFGAVDWGNHSPFGQDIVVRTPSGLKKMVNDNGKHIPVRSLHGYWDGVLDYGGESGATIDVGNTQTVDLTRITNPLYVAEFAVSGGGTLSCGVTRAFTMAVDYYPGNMQIGWAFYCSMSDVSVTYLYY